MTILLAAWLLAAQATAPPAIYPPGSKPFYRTHFTTSCAQWRASRAGKAEDPQLRFLVYGLGVRGWIAGFNVYGPDPTGDLLGATSWDEVSAFIDRYCARHPSHIVVDSLRPLAADLIRRRPVPTRRGPKKKAMITWTTTCREWNEDRDNSILRVANRVGVFGYLTAYNLWGKDPTGDVLGPENDKVADKWIDDWCRERSDVMVIGAVQPLIDHLAAERAAGRLPPGGRHKDDVVGPDDPARRR